jgi:hypothetical protein
MIGSNAVQPSKYAEQSVMAVDEMTQQALTSHQAPPNMLVADDKEPLVPGVACGEADDADPPHPNSKHARVTLARNKVPVDSNGHSHLIFYGAWPMQFPLQTGLQLHSKGMDKSMHVHLLTQFTNVFAQEQNLVFSMFNFYTRKLNNENVHAKLRGKHDALDSLGSIIGSARFHERLQEAKMNPVGKDAQEVLRLVNPFLQITGAVMPFSTAEARGFYQELMAMSHRFGEASYWVTVSPGTDSLSLRLSFPTLQRGKFPATSKLPDGQKWTTLGQALGDSDTPSIKLPCRCRPSNTSFEPEEELPAQDDNADVGEGLNIGTMNFSTQSWNINKYAADNPVACADLFRRILAAVFDVLLGIPSVQHQRKTNMTEEHLKRQGVFGQARACGSASEVQGRKALHVHMLVWTKLSPLFIQWASGCPALMQRIAAVVQSHIQAHIPMEYHVDNMLDKERESIQHKSSLFRSCVNCPFVPYNGSARTLAHYQKAPLQHKERLRNISNSKDDMPSKAFQDLLFPFMCFTQVRISCDFLDCNSCDFLDCHG